MAERTAQEKTFREGARARDKTSRERRGEFRQRDERIARDFLRERNLLSTFNRFKRIRSIKKKKIIVQQDGISHNLIVHKFKQFTVVRDGFSLRVVAKTKRFNVSNIRVGLEKKEVKAFKFAGKTFQGAKFDVRLKEISRIPLTNVVQVDRSSALRKKLGKLFVSITFIGKKGQQATVEGGSRALRLLHVEGEKTKAFNDAFKGALSQIEFSYERFIINWIHFSYFIPKKRPQPIFQEKQILRAV